jgi:UDP-3-O-[3-hydroxymyristoyl] glucosamine N-acyltransferase
VKLKGPVKTGWLCEKLGLKFKGPNREFDEICGLDKVDERALSFVLRGSVPELGRGGVVFALSADGTDGLTVIVSPNPRLDFIRAQYVLEQFPGFAKPAQPPALHPTALVDPRAVIENGVTIGEGTRVGPCAVVRSGSRIGRFCTIKSGAVIGDSGFGFERESDGSPLKMIHLGGVRIGDHVEIGALTTVCRGALGDTVLEDHVKTDDHVHIAHNCRIGAGTMITACAELSGSVIVGEKVWIAPNCSIAQKLTIGDGAFIGIGAVVLHDVKPDTKVFGNPAKKLTGGFAKK